MQRRNDYGALSVQFLTPRRRHSPKFGSVSSARRRYGVTYGTRTKQNGDVDTSGRRGQTIVKNDCHSLIDRDIQAVLSGFEKLNLVRLQCTAINRRVHRNRLHICEPVAKGYSRIDD